MRFENFVFGGNMSDTGMVAQADGEKDKVSEVEPDADNTENGEQNVQTALAAKIAQMDAKKSEDKNGEKELSRLYKKAAKELNQQLEGISSDSEKVKFLQQKCLDKVHQCNASERKVENLQVPTLSLEL